MFYIPDFILLGNKLQVVTVKLPETSAENDFVEGVLENIEKLQKCLHFVDYYAVIKDSNGLVQGFHIPYSTYRNNEIDLLLFDTLQKLENLFNDSTVKLKKVERGKIFDKTSDEMYGFGTTRRNQSTYENEQDIELEFLQPLINLLIGIYRIIEYIVEQNNFQLGLPFQLPPNDNDVNNGSDDYNYADRFIKGNDGHVGILDLLGCFRGVLGRNYFSPNHNDKTDKTMTISVALCDIHITNGHFYVSDLGTYNGSQHGDIQIWNGTLKHASIIPIMNATKFAIGLYN